MKKLVFIVIGLCVAVLAGVWLINWHFGGKSAAIDKDDSNTWYNVIGNEPLPELQTPQKPKPAPAPDPAAAARQAEEMKKREAVVKDAVAKADKYLTLPEYEGPIDHLSLVANILGQNPSVLSDTPASFGIWPQDGTANGRIEWIVALRPSFDLACLVSKYVIEYKPFDDAAGSGGKAGWSGSSLRKWLNGEFYEKAFSDEEKKRILTADVVDFSNGKKVTVKDRVFILCEDELPVYLRGGEEQIKCEPTGYARDSAGIDPSNTGAAWWTRGKNGAGFACVTPIGKTGKPFSAGDKTIGVRPVIWMKAD